MASLMASGKTLNLGIPVLASIYNGLNAISESPTPGLTDSRFPIHYVYGWLSFYFDTHFANDDAAASPMMITYSGEGGARYYGQAEARRKIFKADSVQWNCTTRRLTKDLHFLDDKKGNYPDDEYFMCLRSNYLILRWADSCIAEPYTPHRFSRQFSYYQDGKLGVLANDERKVSLGEGFRRWCQLTFRGSGSRVTFPVTRVKIKKYFSQKYKDWWAQVYGDYLKDLALDHTDVQQEVDTTQKGKRPVLEVGSSSKKRKKNIAPERKDDAVPQDPGDKEKTRRSSPPAGDNIEIPEAESSNKGTTGSNAGENEHSNTAPVLSQQRSRSASDEPHVDQQNRPEVSVFDGKDLVLEEFKVVVINIWNKLREKLNETPVEHISSLQESFKNAFANLRKLDLDISPLEARVDEIFQKAQEYDKLRSTISDKTSSESQGRSLSLAKEKLKKAQGEVVRLKKDLLDQHKTLKVVQDKEKDLEQELKSIRVEKANCGTSITKITEDIDSAKTEVSQAEAEVAHIEKLAVLTPEDEEGLKKAKSDLSAYKDDMLNFRLFVD